MNKSELEREFLFYWAALAPAGCAAPVSEYKFARPARQWRFDFAWPDRKVAVELEGGVYTNGRHVRPAGYQADCAKYNEATQRGWRVLRYTRPMLTEDPARVVSEVARLVMGIRAT